MDTKKLYDLKNNIKPKISARIEYNIEVSKEKLYSLIDCEINTLNNIDVSSKKKLREMIFNSFQGYDVLSDLLSDKSTTEIMINAYNEIFVERNGTKFKLSESFENEEQVENIIQQIVGKINRVVNTSSPIVDARLDDGSRVNVVLPPIALKGATITIRKFPEPITIEKLIDYGSITKEASEFLKELVRAGYNIFISGGTGSGKTTFLNALSNFIPEEERVITIEDSAELNISHVANLVKLETRNSTSSGAKEINMQDLIRAALRMNPDRIIVGEVRGKECLDMLQAMNTGHDGSISTGHANSAYDMLSRMETMVLMASDLPLVSIRNQIISAIDILIHLGRLKNKKRVVLEISELGKDKNGNYKTNKIFEYKRGYLAKCGVFKNTKKLLDRL